MFKKVIIGIVISASVVGIGAGIYKVIKTAVDIGEDVKDLKNFLKEVADVLKD